jgi:hypothetical protein
MPLTADELEAIAARAADQTIETPPAAAAEEPALEIAECPCENLKPMAEWIKGETPGTCRPCTITPVVQWYYQELKEQGNEEVAGQLEQEAEALEEDNFEQVVAICEDLDKIKAAAPPELRRRLEDFDCAVQSFDPNAPDDSEESPSGD